MARHQPGEQAIQIVDQQHRSPPQAAAVRREFAPGGLAVLLFALQCLAWRMPDPCLVDLGLVSLLVVARFKKRLQAVAPEDIHADHVVLLLAKGQADEPFQQVPFGPDGDGNPPQQRCLPVAARRDDQMMPRRPFVLDQSDLPQAGIQRAAARDKVRQKIGFIS